MKNIFKVLAIIALVAVIGFLMACTDGDDGGGQEPITYTGDSIADFAIWLAAQPANTKTRPYIVKLNVSDLGGDSHADGSVGKVLSNNPNKYVSLDLSGSTFTSMSYYHRDHYVSKDYDYYDEYYRGAFEDCSSLISVIIPDSVTSIGDWAFAYFINPMTMNLTSVTIPSSVTSIGENAFHRCDKLTSVNIPDSVISIGGGAFHSCQSLTIVTIPKNVTSIGRLAFAYCDSLTAINVNIANTAYSSQDGVLYDKDKTTLIQCPGGKTGVVAIPNGVTSIREYAFAICENLTSVTIPSSVTSIGEFAFPYCDKLTSVTFATGSNITDVNFGDCAFPPEGSDGYHGGGNVLKTAYLAGKAGTYKRNGDTWRKQ